MKEWWLVHSRRDTWATGSKVYAEATGHPVSHVVDASSYVNACVEIDRLKEHIGFLEDQVKVVRLDVENRIAMANVERDEALVKLNRKVSREEKAIAKDMGRMAKFVEMTNLLSYYEAALQNFVNLELRDIVPKQTLEYLIGIAKETLTKGRKK